MVNNKKRIYGLVYIIAGFCVLGIIREIYLQRMENKIDQSNVATKRAGKIRGESLNKYTTERKSRTPKTIRAKVGTLLTNAHEAVNDKNYDRAVDLYYDAILLEPEIVEKWNKERYIGPELEIIKKLHKDRYFHKRRSKYKEDKILKMDSILSLLYKGCKKTKPPQFAGFQDPAKIGSNKQSRGG